MTVVLDSGVPRDNSAQSYWHSNYWNINKWRKILATQYITIHWYIVSRDTNKRNNISIAFFFLPVVHSYSLLKRGEMCNRIIVKKSHLQPDFLFLLFASVESVHSTYKIVYK